MKKSARFSMVVIATGCLLVVAPSARTPDVGDGRAAAGAGVAEPPAWRAIS